MSKTVWLGMLFLFINGTVVIHVGQHYMFVLLKHLSYKCNVTAGICVFSSKCNETHLSRNTNSTSNLAMECSMTPVLLLVILIESVSGCVTFPSFQNQRGPFFLQCLPVVDDDDDDDVVVFPKQWPIFQKLCLSNTSDERDYKNHKSVSSGNHEFVPNLWQSIQEFSLWTTDVTF